MLTKLHKCYVLTTVGQVVDGIQLGKVCTAYTHNNHREWELTVHNCLSFRLFNIHCNPIGYDQQYLVMKSLLTTNRVIGSGLHGCGLKDLVVNGWSTHDQIRFEDRSVGFQNTIYTLRGGFVTALKDMTDFTVKLGPESPNHKLFGMAIRYQRIPHRLNDFLVVIQRIFIQQIMQRTRFSWITVGTCVINGNAKINATVALNVCAEGSKKFFLVVVVRT
mmetsp:Transcript_2082/g.3685  ORF Transcript_2082/g.3685 Transcript_2082/m.3685 type:complete len:219 (+) Transcript_2082:360-1016(+)